MKELPAETTSCWSQFGTGANAATKQLTAAVVTARFSPVTNQIEKAVAERQRCS